MGLSASMWTSVSGLLAHGNKMNLVGNNIANVSTIGFKSQRMDFNDYLYMSGSSASGPTQVGAGVSTYAVLGDYSQGALETTNSGTDLAIDGNGYFGVRKTGSDQKYYTRAGDFFFDKERKLVNPEGMVVQGWKVENDKALTFSSGATNLGTGTSSESSYVGSGSPTDIVLSSWNLPPQQTTNVSFTMGLTNDGNGDKTTSAGSPLTALFDLWDATSNPPIAKDAFSAKSEIKVYDEGGNAHQLSVYYDQVATSKEGTNGSTAYTIEGLPAGYTVYEYLVTIPPSEDNRSFGGEGYDEATNTWTKDPTKFYDDPTNGTNKQAGVLMSGQLIFNASGQLVNQTAYTFGATGTPAANDQYAGSPDSKESWQPTKLSSNGLPVFTANFTGQPLANSVSETMTTTGTTTPFSQAQKYIMELDLGLKNIGSPAWANPTATTIKTDALGNPVDAGGNALGVSKYGYYNLATGFYGQDAAGHDLLADDKGFYYRDPVSGDNIYGTITVGGNQDVSYDDTIKGYYFTDTTVTPNTKCYDVTVAGTPATTHPAYSDANGSYYNGMVPVAGGGANVPGKIYGTFDDAGNPRPVQHDATGYFYIDGADARQAVTGTFDKIATSKVKPDTYVAIDNTTRVAPDYETKANSLDSLKTQLVPDGVTAEGNPKYKAVVNFATNAASMTTTERQDGASAANSKTSVTQNATQDGYASGTLSDVRIDTSGIIYGVYSNGTTLPLYQITMYDFQNNQGLWREGGNLFSSTNDSGEPRIGVAGDNGFGTTKAYNIEQSNVDMSREFVQMITTQRGFQANSKGITTVDTMLETVIGMKR